MVHIDRVYTRSGDDGHTSLGDGTRVSKLHPRITAGGAVDEVNCLFGVAAAAIQNGQLAETMTAVQQFLFDLGADLCVPLPDNSSDDRGFRVSADHVQRLEQLIDRFTAQLEPLSSFVLPGGTPAAAALHQARAVCRRAEVDVLRLADSERVNPQMLIALNRLSDLAFVMARVANDNGRRDVLWRPGASAEL